MIFNTSEDIDKLSSKFLSLARRFLKGKKEIERLGIQIRFYDASKHPKIEKETKSDLSYNWRVNQVTTEEKQQRKITREQTYIKKKGDATIHLQKEVIVSDVVEVVGVTTKESILPLRPRVNVHEKLIIDCGLKDVEIDEVDDEITNANEEFKELKRENEALKMECETLQAKVVSLTELNNNLRAENETLLVMTRKSEEKEKQGKKEEETKMKDDLMKDNITNDNTSPKDEKAAQNLKLSFPTSSLESSMKTEEKVLDMTPKQRAELSEEEIAELRRMGIYVDKYGVDVYHEYETDEQSSDED